MPLDILDPKTAHKIITDIESQQIRDRRRYEYKQFLCYSGRLREFVEEKLKEALPNDSKWIEAIDINIVQKIMDKLSKSYKQSPKREVEGNDKKTEELTNIYSEGDFDTAFDVFDLRSNLHKYAALWVVKREDQPLKLETVPSYAFFPIFNQDTGEMEGCVLNYPGTDITHWTTEKQVGNSKLDASAKFISGDGVDQIVAESPDDSNPTGNTFAMWTKDQHAVYEVEKVETADGIETIIKFVKINDDEKLNGVNDLGVIPFVYFSMEDGTELPVRNPLSNQAVTYNYYISALLGAALRNIGTAKLKYPEGMDINALVTGLSTAVRLPQSRKEGDPETDLSYENPQSDLTGQLTVYLSILQQIYGQYGIRSNESVQGSSVMEFNSGLERLIANADVQDHIEQMQKHYIKVENAVFQVVKAYMERDGKKIFAEDDKLTVVYQKPKITISDKDKLENLDKRKEMRLMSRVGQMIELDPNLSEEKAIKALEKIDKELSDDAKKSVDLLTRMASDENDSEVDADMGENMPESEGFPGNREGN